MHDPRIPLAPAVRWRRIRAQAMPVAAFLLAAVTSGWLWQRTSGTVQGIGEVDAPRVDVTSPAAGLVVDLPNQDGRQWLTYDQVRAGDVIARIEDQAQPGSLIEVAAPITGTLVAVHCWPGQAVIPGGLIATIAADHGRHIVGYIPESSPVVARPGSTVTLRARTAGARQVTSQVEQVGSRIERIPRHQWATSTTPQWGTPVRIKLPNEAALRPGSLVDLRFHAADRP